MLSADSRTKLQQPGLRFQGFKTLPIGSKIAVVVLSLMALVAIFAPVVAPYSPDATSLVPADMVVMQEVEIAGVRVQFIQQQSEQAGLAAAIGSDQTDFPAGLHGQINVFQQRFATALQGELRQSDQARGVLMK